MSFAVRLLDGRGDRAYRISSWFQTKVISRRRRASVDARRKHNSRRLTCRRESRTARTHAIKKPASVKRGDGQYRVRFRRFRFTYDIQGQAVFLKHCRLRREDEITYPPHAARPDVRRSDTSGPVPPKPLRPCSTDLTTIQPGSNVRQRAHMLENELQSKLDLPGACGRRCQNTGRRG